MNVFGITYTPTDQTELSRVAAERYALDRAVREHRASTPHPTRVDRLRHSLAVRLETTARLIDAT